ncbi:MAG: response regulator [Bacteroidota bacterium]
MSVSGPIIIIEDDLDDQQILQETLLELGVNNVICFFDNCIDVYQYLLVTHDKPFLILSDVNLPVMTGSELKQRINENEELRKKAIPFIFFTTTANAKAVEKAYDMMVQGYFEKDSDLKSLKATLGTIIAYWKLCKHPNNM